jgi:hypothetical protein
MESRRWRKGVTGGSETGGREREDRRWKRERQKVVLMLMHVKGDCTFVMWAWSPALATKPGRLGEQR